jgi:hypothetical protein
MLERILPFHDVFIYCLQSCLLQNLRGSRAYPFVALVLPNMSPYDVTCTAVVEAL